MTQNQGTLIMVIEDETSLLLAIQKRLEKSGFSTITASDAEQAMDYLNNKNKPPDLIWLDYYLPGKSGLQFLTEIKKDPMFCNIPVFVVSNTAGPNKVDAMVELGANKYFVKAEKRLEEIIDEIRKIIKKGENI